MFPDLTRDDVFTWETPRLWLRWPRAVDAPALQAIAAHASVAEMTATWPHPLPEGEAARRILRIRTANSAGEGLALAIAAKARPAGLIGMVGGGADPDDPHVGFGYMLDPAAWGQGLMTEAVGAFADIVLGFTAAPGLRASVMTRNPTSRRVLERNGFRRTGAESRAFPARQGVIDCELFELDRGTWRQHSPLLSSNWHRSAA